MSSVGQARARPWRNGRAVTVRITLPARPAQACGVDALDVESATVEHRGAELHELGRIRACVDSCKEPDEREPALHPGGPIHDELTFVSFLLRLELAPRTLRR